MWIIAKATKYGVAEPSHTMENVHICMHYQPTFLMLDVFHPVKDNWMEITNSQTVPVTPTTDVKMEFPLP